MNNSSNSKVMNIIYFSAFGVILLGLLIFVLITIFKPFDYKSINKLKHTTIENCLQENKNAKGKQSKYYLLVYAKDDDDNKNIEPMVLEYANYLKHHSKLTDTLPIYVLEYDESMASTLGQISAAAHTVDGMPLMFIVNEGAVSTTYETCSKINQALSDALDKLKAQ